VLSASLLPLSPLPLVAIPTTAGTGSEVSPHAIITGDDHRKQVLYDPSFRPRAAALDPRFVLSAPPGVRLAAGLDALTHPVESFLSRCANPITRALSLAAVRAIIGSLPQVVAGAAEPDVSSSVQVAATMAGLAMASAGVGVCHALGHPLTRLYGTVHGLGVSALVAAAIDLQRDAVPDADQLDAAFNGDAATAVRQLRHTLGAPSARDIGLAGANVAELASLREEALTNPAVRDSHMNVDEAFLDSLIARAAEEEMVNP
jgi:alcohol dehydrogenase class IV